VCRLNRADTLTFEACKKIKDFAVLAKCPRLRTLRVLNCGELESLRDLALFPQLEDFRFVKTKIRDGDMSPLLRLKRVGFLKNANYSHTPEQIQQAIGQVE
jgi:hypothetical protein